MGRVLQTRRAMRARRTIARQALLLGLALLLAANARALPVLDQQNAPPAGPLDGALAVNPDDLSLIQTFSVGITGTLVSVDLWLGGGFPSGPGLVPQAASYSIVTIDPHIAPQPRQGADGLELVGQVLASGTVAAPSPDGGEATIDLSALGISVTEGETLGIELTQFAFPEAAGLVFGSDSDSYAGGKIWYRCNIYPFSCGGLPYLQGGTYSVGGGGMLGPGWEPTETDAYFQTYVEPVPEPATLLLVIVGAAGMALPLRRSKR